MTEKHRQLAKLLLISLLVIGLFIVSTKPAIQDISAISQDSKFSLQGQKTTTPNKEASHQQELALNEEINDPPEEPLPNKEPIVSTVSPPSNQQQKPAEAIATASQVPSTNQEPTIDAQATKVEIVASAENDNTYFTTNLKNGLTVTEAAFNLTISQLDSSLIVEEMQIRLNDNTLENFTGELTFTEGMNLVKITMNYKTAEGKPLAVTQSYTITLNTKDIIIQTSVVDESVDQEHFLFTASASQNGQPIEIEVDMNNTIIKPKAGNAFAATLVAGENNFTFTAKVQKETKVEKKTVVYEKVEAQLVFKTDLVDQKIATSTFTFTAEAFYGEQSIDYHASLNGDPLQAAKSYTVQLINGTNTIKLHAVYKDEQLTKQYKILYTDPSVIVTEKKNELAPKIKTDLVSGSNVKGLIKTINVWPTTANGTRIRGKNVAVKVNGVGTAFVWDDAEKTSYKLSLQDGSNNVEIRAWDDDGRVTKESYTITAKNLENQVIGQALVSIEASILGIPYLIPPTKVDIHQGEKGSYIIDQLLRQYGFKYDHTGTLESNFYLSALKKQNMLSTVQIPDDLWLFVEESSNRAIRDDYDPHSLGEFDFANGSGWMFSVNGDYPNYGFSDAYFLDGDVIRIRFTLHYGKDIGGFNGMGGGSGSNWDKEW